MASNGTKHHSPCKGYMSNSLKHEFHEKFDLSLSLGVQNDRIHTKIK